MLFLAIRHLLSRRRQTLLILTGIGLGTLVYVVISGVQLGFRQFIIDKLIDSTGHIRISGHEEEITQDNMQPIFYPEHDQLIHWLVPPAGKRDEAHILYPQGWYERLDLNNDVAAYAPQLTVQAIFARGRVKQTGTVIGIEVDKKEKVTKIAADIKVGHLSQIGNTGHRIIAGSELLKKLGAQLGDTVYLSTGSGESVPFKIIGIYESGVQQLDSTIAYGALADVQQLARTPGRVSDIVVRLTDVDEAKPTANSWNTLSREKVQSWDEANANFLQIFKIQDIVRNFISISLIIVAAFGIYNVLSIIVNQKKREIAILRALGFTPKDIEKLFLQQGFILGILGAVVGMILGFLLCTWISTLKFPALGTHGFIISYAPSIYILGFAMALMAALVASFIPARAARRMTPVDIIRSEG